VGRCGGQLGAGHIRVFGGKVPAGATEEQAAQWVADVLKVGTEYAGSKGIILGLENHGGITERADTVIKIVKGVNSPWLGINLDTGNFNKNAYKQIEMCLPCAVNAQFKTHIKAGEVARVTQRLGKCSPVRHPSGLIKVLLGAQRCNGFDASRA
jgi:sugar phosphate isomerase/epimerase